MSVYQQNFCGNHVAKLLQEVAIEDYMSIFDEHPHCQHMKGFLKALGEFQRLCVPRLMTANEMEQMENAIDTIWFHIQKFASNDTVTPKLHTLLEHVMPFVKEHGTLARTSEQSIEAQHACYNAMKAQLRTTRNSVLKATQCFRSLLYKNYIHDSC